MSCHDENNAIVYKCKNCNKYYTDHYTKEEIEEHHNGKCKNKGIIIKDLSFNPDTSKKESTAEGALKAFKTIVENFNPGYTENKEPNLYFCKKCKNCIGPQTGELDEYYCDDCNPNINKQNKLDWTEYFIRMAYLVASKSKDNSSKIGSVLVRDNMVLSCGFNGIPINCKDNIPERNERPEKYYFYEHSERNCLYFAARNGINTNSSELFTLSVPCSDCARGLIQSGCCRITYHVQHNGHFELQNPKWADSIKKSLLMFDEAGVKVVGFNKWLGFTSLINGKDLEV